MIDVPLLLVVAGALLGAAAWIVKRTGVGTDPRALGERLSSKTVFVSIALAVNALLVMQTLHRSPGQRLAGIRTADAKSGGPPTLRQAVILEVVPIARSWLFGRMTRRLRPPEQPAAHNSQALEELMRAHAGDPAARRKAMSAYYRDQPPRTLSLFSALRQPLAQAALALAVEGAVRRRSPARSLAEVLAGTMVVVDR